MNDIDWPKRKRPPVYPLRLPPELMERIRQKAERYEASINEVIEILLRRGLK